MIAEKSFRLVGCSLFGQVLPILHLRVVVKTLYIASPYNSFSYISGDFASDFLYESFRLFVSPNAAVKERDNPC